MIVGQGLWEGQSIAAEGKHIFIFYWFQFGGEKSHDFSKPWKVDELKILNF